MKKLALILATLLAGGGAPAFADLNSNYSSTVNLRVEAGSITNERLSSQYSVSGTNVSGTLGSLGAGTAGVGIATTAASSVAITNAGDAFQFAESAFAGQTASAMAPGVVNMSSFSTAGNGDKQTFVAGGYTAGLAGTIDLGGTSTITAGGAGTSATAVRSTSLSVF